MCAKKKRGGVQKRTPAAKNANQSEKSKRTAKKIIKPTKVIKTDGNVKKPGSLQQNSKLVQTIKKTRTETTRTTRSVKQAGLPNRKNPQEQKKKKPKETIKSDNSSKKSRLLQQQRNLKGVPKNIKAKAKNFRNSKKPTMPPSLTETWEEGRCTTPQDVITSNMPSLPSRIETSEKDESTPLEVMSTNTPSTICRTEIGVESSRISPATPISIMPSLVSRFQTNPPPSSIPASLISPSCSRPDNGEDYRRLPPGTLTSNITPWTKSATGFERNLEPFKIVHMAEVRNELFFVMKWKGSVVMDLVPLKTAKERCPQLVIQFYQSRLTNIFGTSV